MKRKGFFVASFLLFAGCNNQEETPAGGPCTYKNTVLPAKLIQLISRDSLNFDAAFEINRPSGITDTVYYQEIHHRLLSAEELRKNSLHIGQTCEYQEQDLLTGSCNPHIVSIQLKNY